MVISCHLVAVHRFPLLLCLAIVSSVYGCTQMPSGQGRAVNFTVGGFTLPSAVAFSTAAAVISQVAQISRTSDAATAIVRNLVMQAVNDVLEERGRNEGLPGFVVSAILGQLSVQVNYVPINCAVAYTTPANQAAGHMANVNNCFIISDTVTALCMMNPCALSPMAMNILPIPQQHLSITGSVMTTNFIMATWTAQMWQGVFNRALQFIRRGSFGTNFASAFVTVM